MKNRRSLTPGTGTAAGEVHAMRRGDARREVASRVTLKASSGAVLDGWALNVSRGGVRVILEDKVDLGAEFEVILADDGTGPMAPRTGRVVWVQEEPDGVVAGIEFRGASTRLRALSSRPPDGQ